MRLTIALVIGLAAVPATAQRPPITKLLDKIPSVFGSGPKQPAITLPATPVILGLTRAADRSVAGDPVTFDLGGFRLGMSEAEVSEVAMSRKLITKGATRFVDFEGQVRIAINIAGGAGGAPTRRSVLGEATLQDDAGGRYMLRMLVWPDGSHLSGITYIAPQGTAAADWRQMLVTKWGTPHQESSRDAFSARWGKAGLDGYHAVADVGLRGGTVGIGSPDGSSRRPAALVAQATDAFVAARARKPAL